jgi:hypothetical protein
MARKPARSVRQPISPAALAKLEQTLTKYCGRVEQLEHEMAINIRRMGTIQADVDELRRARTR